MARARELNEKFQQALLALPEHHLEIFFLRECARLPYSEIAKELRFGSQSNARQALFRAKERLRELMSSGKIGA
jgi:RNA polymerase sigma factor (sigma-70 family)